MVSAAEVLEILRDVRQAIEETGVTATLIDPNSTYSTATGGVTEAPVTSSVRCSPLVDESKRWNDPSITATVYLAAEDMTLTPRPGFRLVVNGRTFAVIAAFPYSIKDTVLAWRLDVGEVA